MKTQKLVCFHSLTAHGAVGLKPFLALFGEAVLPVPSLLLTGPGDMPECRRFDYDFVGMLDGALTAAAARRERVWVFVGYLAQAAQVELVEAALERHTATIAGVIVDPVSGDDGRAYVAPALLAAWPRLLARANWVLPNLTEAELLTGARGEAAVASLRAKFPDAHLIVTGWPAGEHIATRLYACGDTFTEHVQPRIGGRFNGTGDLFAAAWCREILLRGTAPKDAMRLAAETVSTAIAAAVRNGTSELVLHAFDRPIFVAETAP